MLWLVVGIFVLVWGQPELLDSGKLANNVNSVERWPDSMTITLHIYFDEIFSINSAQVSEVFDGLPSCPKFTPLVEGSIVVLIQPADNSNEDQTSGFPCRNGNALADLMNIQEAVLHQPGSLGFVKPSIFRKLERLTLLLTPSNTHILRDQLELDSALDRTLLRLKRVLSPSCPSSAHPACKNCDSEDRCIECDPGYTLDNTPTCLCDAMTADSFCADCDSSGDCSVCVTGYSVADGSCICDAIGVNYCISCDSSGSCTECSNGGDSGNNCDCYPGSYMGSSSCESCSTIASLCSECSDATTCTACSNGGDPGSNCDCYPGSYMGSSSCESCSTISSPCSECTDSTTCTACSNGEDPSINCGCFPGSYMGSSGCESCSTISPSCSECTDSTTCTICSNGGDPTDSCNCYSTQAFDAGSSHCVQCSSVIQHCQTCESTETCLSCSAGTLSTSGKCIVCPSNEYLSTNSVCMLCRSPCTECLSYDVCTDCGANASLAESDCLCDPDHVIQGQDCVPTNATVSLSVTESDDVLITFSKPLDEPFTASNLDLEIEEDPSFSWTLYNMSSTAAKLSFRFNEDIYSGQVLYVTFRASVQGRVLNSIEETTVEVELNSVKVVEESTASETVSDGIGPATSVVFLSGLSSMDFTAVWSMVNSLEVIRYIAMTNNPLSPGLYAMLGAVGHYNSMVNFFKYFIDDDGSKPYDAAYHFGYKTNMFLVSGGKFLSMLCVFLGIGAVLLVLSFWGLRKKYKFFNSMCKPFCFDIFTRFFVQSYLTLGVCGVLQVLDVRVTQVNYDSRQGMASFYLAIVTLVSGLFLPFLISIFTILRRREVADSDNETFHNRWGSLYGEFKQRGGMLVYQFYAFFLFRRFLLILSVMFLNNSPRAQATCNLILAVLVRTIQSACYIILVKPFRSKLFQYLNYFNELIVVTIYAIALGLLQLDTLESRDDLGYCGVWLILLLIAVNFCIAIFKNGQSIVGLCRKKQATLSETIVDTTPKELTVVFEDIQRKSLNRSKSEAPPSHF